VPLVRILLAALGALSVIGSGISGTGGPQTVYRSATGPISAFAADGSLLAWFAPGGHTCNAVYVLSLSGVKVTLPKPGTANVTCRWSVGTAPVRLAIAETSGAALWTLHERSQVDLDYVVGADASQPLERRFDQLAHTPAGAGLWLGGIAGSGGTLVYAVTVVAYVDQVACLSGGSCRLKIQSGGVRRVLGRRNPLIPGTGPAVDVAASAGRIAYIPAAGVGKQGLPVASSAVSIPVRSANGGALLARIEPQGLPLGIALAPHVLALIERGGGRTDIDWYDPENGDELGSVRVPPSTSTGLTATDQVIVYRVGRAVHAIDVATAQTRTLLTAPATPIGLTVDGDHLLWAENVRGKGRIRSLALD
jgi:hypothetical protein